MSEIGKNKNTGDFNSKHFIAWKYVLKQKKGWSSFFAFHLVLELPTSKQNI